MKDSINLVASFGVVFGLLGLFFENDPAGIALVFVNFLILHANARDTRNHV